MRDRRTPKKRALNVAGLLDESRRIGVNLSDVLEQRLRIILRAEREKRWVQENQQAIESINQFIDRHGLLAARLRLRPQP